MATAGMVLDFTMESTIQTIHPTTLGEDATTMAALTIIDLDTMMDITTDMITVGGVEATTNQKIALGV